MLPRPLRTELPHVRGRRGATYRARNSDGGNETKKAPATSYTLLLAQGRPKPSAASLSVSAECLRSWLVVSVLRTRLWLLFKVHDAALILAQCPSPLT